MIAHEVSYQSRAASETPVVPALEIERLLECLTRDKAWIFSEYDYQIIQDGIEFLNLASHGREIAQRTIREGKISIDLASIRAFLIVSQGVRQSKVLQVRQFDEVIEIAKNVLEAADAKTKTEINYPSKESIEITRELFLYLSKLPMPSGR